MRSISLLILMILYGCCAFAQFTLRLSIGFLPSDIPPNENIFIAGTFNNWNPDDENYKFQKSVSGYSITINVKEKAGEYKLTRGSWAKVECDKNGNSISNRQYSVESSNLTDIIIEGWTDLFPPKTIASTASKNVKIIDTAFLIPQLHRKRTIRIYLPGDYSISKTRYPVLYMHDGQNLFDDATSFAGEWGVDEFMDSTKIRKAIIVGIDNGSNKRANEYNPYDHKDFGKGEGNAYIDFIAKSLKSYIDKNYRTLKDKSNTMIAGSSMGGLISFFAILKYPKIFGAAGVYSPSFWVAPGIFNNVKLKGKNINSKIYYFAGKQEGGNMVSDALKMYNTMHKVSKSKMKLVIKDDGEHNEVTWRKDFPEFYKWIMN